MRHTHTRSLGASLLAVLILFLPGKVRADTFLNAPAYSGQVTFTKEGNPYILNGDLLLEPTGRLTIEKGVVIKGYASTTLPFLPYLNLQGSVKMLGTKD